MVLVKKSNRLILDVIIMIVIQKTNLSLKFISMENIKRIIEFLNINGKKRR